MIPTVNLIFNCVPVTHVLIYKSTENSSSRAVSLAGFVLIHQPQLFTIFFQDRRKKCTLVQTSATISKNLSGSQSTSKQQLALKLPVLS